MSKIFFDNSILPKGWRKVDPTLKLAFYHFWTNCDKAGVFEIDEDLFEFETGVEWPKERLEVLKQLKLIDYKGDILIVKDFIAVDCNGIPDERKNPHKPLFRSLQKHGLILSNNKDEILFPSTLDQPTSNVKSTLTEGLIKVDSTVVVEDVVMVEDKEEEKRGILKGENQIIPEKEADKQLVGEILKYFGFTEVNFDKMRLAGQFVKVLDYNKQLEIFKEQFPAYQQYKEITKERTHHFNSFLGDIQEKFMDGGWNANNWVKKLQDLKDNNEDGSSSYSDRKKEFLSA